MGCIFILKDHLCQAEIRVFDGRRNLTSPAKQYENRAIQDQGSGGEDAYSVVDKVLLWQRNASMCLLRPWDVADA